MDSTIKDVINFGVAMAKLLELARAHESVTHPRDRVYIHQGGDSNRPQPLEACQPTFTFDHESQRDGFVDAVRECFDSHTFKIIQRGAGPAGKFFVRIHLDKFSASCFVNDQAEAAEAA